uniref:Uncharacterized protein n=1 Tax=Anguilla anguilla TaxID=7936 RepID=A0A0E9RVJ9_ANGAN
MDFTPNKRVVYTVEGHAESEMLAFIIGNKCKLGVPKIVPLSPFFIMSYRLDSTLLSASMVSLITGGYF